MFPSKPGSCRTRRASGQAPNLRQVPPVATLVVLVALAAAPLPAVGSDGSAAAGLRAPITVQELLPAGHPGFPRVQAPVCAGIPLPDGTGIKSVDQLRLVGTSPYQLQPMGYWEDSGNLKWVRADFAATIGPGMVLDEIFLTGCNGTPEENGYPDLGVELPDRVFLDTGVLEVIIARDGPGLIRRVRVDGQTLVDGDHAFRLDVIGMDGTSYPAMPTPDPARLGTPRRPRVDLVENGPQKAVVRIAGEHAANGEHLADFELRLTAYRGQRHLDGVYTLKNASAKHPRHIRHQGVRLNLKTRLAGPKRVRFPVPDSDEGTSFVLGNNGHAYLYTSYNTSVQAGAFNVRTRRHEDGWVPPVPFDPVRRRYLEEGSRIVKNDRVLMQTPATGYTELQYVDLSDKEGRGVLGALRFGARYWPVSSEAFGAAGGAISLGLFSDRSPLPHTVNFYTHQTREFTLEFHGLEIGAANRAFQHTYPLMGRVADTGYLNKTGVLTDKLVSLDSVNRIFEEAAVPATLTPNNQPFDAVRYYAARQGGGHNQYDTTYHHLLRYLRTGDAGAFFKAKSWADYRADNAILRSDDFVLALNGDSRFPWVAPVNHGEFRVAQGHVFDNQHRHTRGLPLLHYLTGDPRYRDAFLDDTELVTFSDRVSLAYLNTRVQSKLIQNGMLGYRFLGEVDRLIDFSGTGPFDREEIYANMQGYLRAILDARYDMNRACAGAQPKGWSDEPGESFNDPRRFWFGNGDRERNVEPKFMVTTLFPEMLWSYHELADADDPLLPEIRLRILDLEHYFWTSLYATCPADPAGASIGDPFYKLFDAANCEIPRTPACASSDDFHPAYALEAFAYRITGNPVHLQRGMQFMLGQYLPNDQLTGLNAYRGGFLNFANNYLRHRLDSLAPLVQDVRLNPGRDEADALVRWTSSEPSFGRVLVWGDAVDPTVTESEGLPTMEHEVAIDELAPLTDYAMRALSRDFSGNESGSETVFFEFDDFREDSLDEYMIREQGGGRLLYSPAHRAVRCLGAADSLVSIERRLPEPYTSGSFTFELDEHETNGDAASLTVLLRENSQTYYRFVIARSGPEAGSVIAQKYVGGKLIARGLLRDAFGSETVRPTLLVRASRIIVRSGSSSRRLTVETPDAVPIRVQEVIVGFEQLDGVLDNLFLSRD